ncbi:mitochondrial proton/calcium exchanger protein-like protein isoform X1 [Tanacetum coccineum]
MSESTKRHEENSNLIKEIQASTDAAIKNQGASIKTLENQIGQMSKSISTTIEADSYPLRRIGSSQYAVSTEQNRTLMYETRQTSIPFPSRLNGYYCKEKKGSYGPQFLEAYSEASHIDNSIPRKEKDPVSFTLPCFINNVCFYNALVDFGASVSVMPLLTYLNLGLGELAHTKLTVELADKTVKYPKGIAENMLTIFVYRPCLINVYKRKITLRIGEERIIFKSVKPASSLIKRVYMLSLRERMELDLEARLMGETLVINRSLDPLNRDYIELNDLNEPFELRRNQGDDLMPTIEECKVIEEFRTRDDELDTGIDNYPCYCDHDKKIYIDCTYNLKFSCMIDFAVLEDMDAYRDEGIGDVIFGESFLREVGINARRFDGMITIYNGNDEVTYQMVRSHPRFKHHTNEQCNKIPPLLKVSEEDKMNEISHPYQKLKGFYKGVLNLGPDYIRDANTEEWLTRGHISVHEMKPIRRIHQGRYGVSVPALTKDHKRNEDQYAVSRGLNTPQYHSKTTYRGKIDTYIEVSKEKCCTHRAGEVEVGIGSRRMQGCSRGEGSGRKGGEGGSAWFARRFCEREEEGKKKRRGIEKRRGCKERREERTQDPGAFKLGGTGGRMGAPGWGQAGLGVGVGRLRVVGGLGLRALKHGREVAVGGGDKLIYEGGIVNLGAKQKRAASPRLISRGWGWMGFRGVVSGSAGTVVYRIHWKGIPEPSGGGQWQGLCPGRGVGGEIGRRKGWKGLKLRLEDGEFWGVGGACGGGRSL